MSHPFKDTTPEREAAPSELEAYDDLQQRVNELDYDGTYKGGDNQRLFFVSFDGTRNNRDNVDADNVHTNPDILERIVDQQARENPQIASWYNQGVGTEEDLFPGVATYRAATGAGSEQYAQESYNKFTKQVQQWHRDNPSIEVHVSTAGFSRGTGSQRHFANLVEERGVLNSDGGYLIPPGGVHQDGMLIFDSVVTGQEDNLSLNIPDSVKNVVHMTANDENRIKFDLTSVTDPNNPNESGILEYGLPGAHSDIGGNYNDPLSEDECSIYDNDQFGNGLSALSLEVGYGFLKNSGVPLGDELPLEYQHNPENNIIHNSGSKINPVHWENGEREVFYPASPKEETVLDRVTDSIGDIVDSGIEMLDGAVDWVADAVSGAVDAVSDFTVDVWENVTQIDDLFIDAWDDSVEAVKDIFGYGENDNTFVQSTNSENVGLFHNNNKFNSQGTISNATNLYGAIDNGNWGAAFNSAAGLANSMGYGQIGNVVGGVGSAYNFYEAASSGNVLGMIGAGAGMYSAYSNYMTGESDSSTVSTVTGVINAYNAIDEGDYLGAASSMLSLGGSNPLSTALNFGSMISDGDYMGAATAAASFIPGVGGYAAAAASLIEGDIEGAALGAATAYLATIVPWGTAAAIILNIFGGSLFGSPPPPEAWADFVVNEDGSIGYDVDSNETGEGLEASVDGYSESMAGYIASLRDLGIEVQTDYIPRLGLKEEDWYLQTNYDGQKVKAYMDADRVPVLMKHSITTAGMLDRGETSFKLYENPYVGLTDWSHTFNMTGVHQSQDVQKQYAATTIDSSGIKTVNAKPKEPVYRPLEKVGPSIAINSDMFRGEAGKQLAVALGAGAVTLSQLAAAAPQLPDVIEVDLFSDDHYASLLEESSNIIIGGVSYNAAGKYTKEEIAPSGDYSIDYSDSLFERHDVYRDIITSVMNDEIYVKAA